MNDIVNGLGDAFPALIGALIGASGAVAVAFITTRRTIAGQRQLARDEALRRWRSELIQPALQAARAMDDTGREYVTALVKRDITSAQSALKDFNEKHRNFRVTTLAETGDIGLIQATENLFKAISEFIS